MTIEKNKRNQWQELGMLKKPRKGFDLSFWRFVILINWAKDWTWAGVQYDGDLRHVLIGLTKRQRMGASGDILNCYGIYIFKLSFVWGIAK